MLVCWRGKSAGCTSISIKRITDTTGHSIPEIFEGEGEAAFRKLEYEELARTLGEAKALGRPTIVSLGGGTTAQPANLAVLERNARHFDLAALPR